MTAPNNSRQTQGLDRERLALEIRRARRPFAVLVVFVALGIAAVLVILRNVGVNLPWSNTYTAHIAVPDASGIAPGADQVRIKGFDVGRVDGVKLEHGQAVATISFPGKYGPLYRDAQLQLRPATPLQDIYVDIVNRGHPSAGALGSNDVLPAARTSEYVPISAVLDVFDPNQRKAVAEAITALGRGLPDHGADLRATLVQLAPFLQAAKRVTQVIAARPVQTRRLIHNFGLMTGELASRNHDLTRIVRTGAQTLTELGARQASVEQTIADLPPTMRALDQSFTTLRAAAVQLDPTFDTLLPTARALPAGMRALRTFSDVAAPALAAFRRPLPPLNSLVSALRPAAGGLASAFRRLQPVAPRFDRVTSLITPCEPALQKFFTNTISLTKFYSAKSGAPILRAITVVAGGGGVPAPNQTVVTSCTPGGPGG